ncbi:MAG: biotin synthase BioB, partial [Brevinematales bacterium]
YCMVFSGSAPDDKLIEHITDVSEKIRDLYNISICVSAGFLTRQNASKLKASGVGRYNHNLNTSFSHYKNICTSHDYSKRLETVNTAREAGLEVCSGVIIGMGESLSDIFSMAGELRKVRASSVPVNFYIPGKNKRLPDMKELTPEYCLRVLCAFRLMLPSCELRIAAGREYHLRGMQAMSLFPANSLFAKGYLTAGGDGMEETRKMIQDAGFLIDRFEG